MKREAEESKEKEAEEKVDLPRYPRRFGPDDKDSVSPGSKKLRTKGAEEKVDLPRSTRRLEPAGDKDSVYKGRKKLRIEKTEEKVDLPRSMRGFEPDGRDSVVPPVNKKLRTKEAEEKVDLPRSPPRFEPGDKDSVVSPGSKKLRMSVRNMESNEEGIPKRKSGRTRGGEHDKEKAVVSPKNVPESDQDPPEEPTPLEIDSVIGVQLRRRAVDLRERMLVTAVENEGAVSP